MISYLSGKIVLKTAEFAILEVNEVGYEVWLAEKSLERLPEKGGTFSLFCHLEANERGVKLYGFLDFFELELFKIIRGIQGVGPKASLEISSFGSLEKIKEKIDKGEDIFEGLSGIGPKKGQKILLEISGKIKTADSVGKTKNALEQDEAFLALLGLGFSKEKIKEALDILPQNLEPKQKITQALQLLGQ